MGLGKGIEGSATKMRDVEVGDFGVLSGEVSVEVMSCRLQRW